MWERSDSKRQVAKGPRFSFCELSSDDPIRWHGAHRAYADNGTASIPHYTFGHYMRGNATVCVGVSGRCGGREWERCVGSDCCLCGCPRRVFRYEHGDNTDVSENNYVIR